MSRARIYARNLFANSLREMIHNSHSCSIERPKFLITVDVEGDNLWSRPRIVKTRNAEFMPRFQELCERYAMRPTYLTNYEMAMSDAYVEFGRDVIARNVGEIGMHLHAWDSPPHDTLTDDDFANHPYLVEYPEAVVREKVTTMTDLLEDRFETKMLSHRAGRWTFDGVYAVALLDMGYRVDCSVTPHVSWHGHKGVPDGNGGADYRAFPSHAYYMDLEDISRAGDSDLLEVPMTITPCRFSLANIIRSMSSEGWLVRRAMDKFFPAVEWLRPHGDDLDVLRKILLRALAEKRDYVQFMIHSSELMPGGSPSFPAESDIEVLYEEIEALFAMASERFDAATLSEYALQFAAKI